MKRLIYTAAILFSPLLVVCQDITGLWRGTMQNDSATQALPYEIFITKTGGKYSGYSHTWFMVEGQKYYGIKKLKVSVAKDGKIVIQDIALLDNNYPFSPDKNIFQLNVLDLITQDDLKILNGLFATNRTKEYNSLTGRINIKKVNLFTESDLIAYLQKSGIENDLTAAK